MKKEMETNRHRKSIVKSAIMAAAMALTLILNPMSAEAATPNGFKLSDIKVSSGYADSIDKAILKLDGTTVGSGAVGYQSQVYSYNKDTSKSLTGECQAVALTNLLRRRVYSDSGKVIDVNFDYVYFESYACKEEKSASQIVDIAKESAKLNNYLGNGYIYVKNSWAPGGTWGENTATLGAGQKFAVNGTTYSLRKVSSVSDVESELKNHPEGLIAYYNYPLENGKKGWHWVVITGKDSNGKFKCINALCGSTSLTSLPSNYTFSYAYVLDTTISSAVISMEDYNSKLKEASNPAISINMTSAPSTITKGNSFYLKGAITATDCTLTTITGKIYKGSSASGTVVESYSYSASGTSLSISTNNIDKFAFRKLAAGTYTLELKANGTNGASKTYTKTFTVSAPAPVININMTSAPTTITKGNSFYLKGTIKATDCTLGTITGKIYKGSSASGTPVQSYSYTASGTSLTISTNNIDKFAFRKLAAGTYTLEIVAKGSDGASKTYTKTFTVK